VEESCTQAKAMGRRRRSAALQRRTQNCINVEQQKIIGTIENQSKSEKTRLYLQCVVWKMKTGDIFNQSDVVAAAIRSI
jgi:hypothetical protein